MLTHQISFESVYCITFQGWKTAILDKCWHLDGSCTSPLYQEWPNLVCAKYHLDHLILPHSRGENPQILQFFWTSVFCGVAKWWHMEKVERGCTTTNLPLSNSIKIVSIFQPLHGEIVQSLCSKAQRTHKLTNKQNSERFWPPRQWAKSELHQTWHDDRGPQAYSCTSKNFLDPMHSFAARHTENFWGNPPTLTWNPHNSINS